MESSGSEIFEIFEVTFHVEDISKSCPDRTWLKKIRAEIEKDQQLAAQG